jgi:hypothetical protein
MRRLADAVLPVKIDPRDIDLAGRQFDGFPEGLPVAFALQLRVRDGTDGGARARTVDSHDIAPIVVDPDDAKFVIVGLEGHLRLEAERQASSPLRLGCGSCRINAGVAARRHDIDDGIGGAEPEHVSARTANRRLKLQGVQMGASIDPIQGARQGKLRDLAIGERSEHHRSQQHQCNHRQRQASR